MPRQPRRESSSGVYHCMLRGVNKQDIFFDRKDYEKFLQIMERTKNKYLYQLYSYVLMPNHIHLEIRDKNQKLSQIIHSMATSYANYFNKKYQRVGHLFQSRFQSKNVENSYYLLNLIRYIHQNPVKAGITQIDRYPWSSYPEYFKKSKKRKEKNTLVNTDEVLFMFSAQKEQAKKLFLDFNHKDFKIRNSSDFLEYEIKNKLSDNELIYFIKEELGIDNIQEIQKYNINDRNEVIKKISNRKGITQKQIARVLGIHIRMIQRITSKSRKLI